MKSQLTTRTRTALSVSAIALALSVAFGAGVQAYAAEKTAAPPAQSQPSKTDENAVLRYSLAGRDAMENINIARMHLNDGQTDLAKSELQKAQTALLTAKAEAPTFVGTTKVMVQGKQVGEESTKETANLVPISSDIVLAENFKITEKHRPVMARAKELFAKGDRKGAAETLKLGNVDIAVNRVWMPLAGTEKLLDQAISQTAKKDYYAANLTLKAIQDNLTVDTAAYDASPAPHAKS